MAVILRQVRNISRDSFDLKSNRRVESPFPIDLTAQTLNHRRHEVFRDVLGAANIEPLSLDQGRVMCLWGQDEFWATDFADEHQYCQVIAITQGYGPTWIPQNMEIQKMKLDEPGFWTFREKFDHVFGRPKVGLMEDPEKLIPLCFE